MNSNQLLKLTLFLAQINYFTSAFILSRTSIKSTSKRALHHREVPRVNTLPPLHAKKKFKINTNISTSEISSDGLLAERKSIQQEQNSARDAVKSNLGVSSKNKKSSSSDGKVKNKKLSNKAEKLAKQRNGDVDSTLQAGLAMPEDQYVQIQVAKRGSKTVTIVRGLTSPMDERKKLLKELKSKIGGGGTLVEGVVSECV